MMEKELKRIADALEKILSHLEISNSAEPKIANIRPEKPAVEEAPAPPEPAVEDAPAPPAPEVEAPADAPAPPPPKAKTKKKAPAAPTAPPAPVEAAPLDMSAEAVNKALGKEYHRLGGNDAAMDVINEVFKEFGVTGINTLDPAQYSEFLAKVQARE